MKKSPKSISKRKSATVAGGLLTSAGATLLPKAVDATMITESTDFSNTFAGRNSLASGVDSVQGTLVNTGEHIDQDPSDYFVFTGLQAGANFTLQLSYVEGSGFPGTETLEWRLEPTGTPVLNSTSVASPPGTSEFMGIVPLNGNIAADVLLGPGGFPNRATYRVDLTVGGGNGVPESGGTMLLMGAAVAGLALAKKMGRRKKKS
jgi:hypothetical protein